MSAEQAWRREVLFAVALADPERALGLIDQAIDQAQKSSEVFGRSSLIELMMTLTAPTEKLRVNQLNHWVSHSWTPGSEDEP
jgi:hypothetical protein